MLMFWWAFFTPIQNHFRKVTKMIIHIKDLVEATTCCVKATAAFPITNFSFRAESVVCLTTREMAAVLFLSKTSNIPQL